VKDPPRILEEGHDRAKALLRAESGEVPPPGAADRVLVALGVGAAAGGAVVTAKGAAASASKWLWIGMIGGAVAIGGVIAQRASSAPSVAPRQVDDTGAAEALRDEMPVIAQAAPSDSIAPLPEAPPAPAAATQPAAAPEPSAAPTPAATEPSARRRRRDLADPNEGLKVEIGYLDGARAALAAGQPATALAWLDDYRDRFSPGRFEPEAFVIRLDALARSGDGATAQRLARDYLATHPTTPHAPRIRRILETAEAKSPAR